MPDTSPTPRTSTAAPTTASETGIAPDKLRRIIASRSFCTLATATPDARPHVAGINYAFVKDRLYFLTGLASKKVLNIRANPRVAVHIPVRQYPVGPPYSVQFTGTADILAVDDAEIVSLLDSGKLKNITRFGVLKEPDICFLKVTPSRKIQTYGIGVPLRTLLASTANGDRTVILD